VNQSTLNIFSTDEKTRKSSNKKKAQGLKTTKKKKNDKHKKINLRNKRIQPMNSTNLFSIELYLFLDVNIVTEEKVHPQFPQENNSTQNEVHPQKRRYPSPESKMDQEIKKDESKKTLINPQEINLGIQKQTNSNNSRKSEIVSSHSINNQPKHTPVQRMQSEASLTASNKKPATKDSRTSSINYNPVISRQTTYRGDSFGNKEGLKRSKKL